MKNEEEIPTEERVICAWCRSWGILEESAKINGEEVCPNCRSKIKKGNLETLLFKGLSLHNGDISLYSGDRILSISSFLVDKHEDLIMHAIFQRKKVIVLTADACVIDVLHVVEQ